VSGVVREAGDEEAANLGAQFGKALNGEPTKILWRGYGIQKRSMWPFAHFFMYFLYIGTKMIIAEATITNTVYRVT
jgi:hypothetical protein